MLKGKLTALILLKREAFNRQKGQSYIELAIAIPVILIMLAGMTEVAFFIARYLDFLDLTREAARFASVREFALPPAVEGDTDCSTSSFNFFYDTACIFSAPPDSASCTDDKFCQGINTYTPFKMDEDDVVISVFTMTYKTDTGTANVTNEWPTDGPWALSDFDSDTAHNDNWKTDCRGSVVRDKPYFTKERIEALAQDATWNKGYVAVEGYYCYHQVLNLPVVSQFIPNPMRIHAYTLMPLPAAAPTPTAIP